MQFWKALRDNMPYRFLSCLASTHRTLEHGKWHEGREALRKYDVLYALKNTETIRSSKKLLTFEPQYGRVPGYGGPGTPLVYPYVSVDLEVRLDRGQWRVSHVQLNKPEAEGED